MGVTIKTAVAIYPKVKKSYYLILITYYYYNFIYF